MKRPPAGIANRLPEKYCAGVGRCCLSLKRLYVVPRLMLASIWLHKAAALLARKCILHDVSAPIARRQREGNRREEMSVSGDVNTKCGTARFSRSIELSAPDGAEGHGVYPHRRTIFRRRGQSLLSPLLAFSSINNQVAGKDSWRGVSG